MIVPLLIGLLHFVWVNDDSGWSTEAVVRRGSDVAVRYQARVEDNYLVVRAMHEKGWHTYAMDNELQAAAVLKGKKSLGIEQGIEIKVESGLELEGRWLQTEPIDLSRPELRWITFGFEQTALFVCPVKKVTSDPVVLRIRGQACSGETCCQVDVELKFPVVNQSDDESAPIHDDDFKVMLQSLVPVKSVDSEAKD